jgi:hypothetical protein
MKMGFALAVALVAIPPASVPNIALADSSGQVAAGVVGGLVGGMLLGSALAPRPAQPAPVYVRPGPVYYEAPQRCYWTRAAPVWDDELGGWVRPRVQVCD